MSSRTPEPVGTLATIVVPVADIDRGEAFVTDVLGLRRRFRDGDRWAAFDAAGTTLALAGPGDHSADGRPAVGFRVADVEAAARRAREAGAEVSQPRVGEHETVAEVRDVDGNLFYFYAPAGA